MNKNIGAIIGIVLIVLVVGGVYVSMTNSSKENAVNEIAEKVSVENSVVEEEKKSVDVEKKQMMKTGSYESFSSEKIALAETGDVVLFFHASWCPSCRGLNSDIEKNINSIPDGVTILKLDYDKETELKKKYGVTTQHTLVQVDKDGNMIKKWSGGSTLATIISQIQ